VRTAIAALVTLAACGGSATFQLSADENNRYALSETLAKRQLPESPAPVNSFHDPRVFALEVGSPKTIVAYDLAANKLLWKADGDVRSRIAVGGDFIVELEGGQLVARDQARGTVRWKVDIKGSFVGCAADKNNAYLVRQDGSTWWLTAYDGSKGDQLWKADAIGKLGAPAAQGGLVYVPFLSQWLSIVDARTGKQLTRVRGIGEEISLLRVTSQQVYFGSKKGVFQLDARSATGKRDDSTYGQLKIPPQLDLASYGRDMYDIVQQGYTAADRARLLWTSPPNPPGEGPAPMRLTGGGYAIHYFRYVLGYGEDGNLRWAYTFPRVELVASEDTGSVIAGLSSTGQIVTLDPQTGAVRSRGGLGTTAQVLGATFDADGWSPAGQAEPVDTLEALVAIARDHEGRFDKVKELAVVALAKLPGPAVTTELLNVLADNRAPQHLKDTVVDLLVARKDPASLPVLTTQLEIRTDYIAKTDPDSLGPVAKAVAGLAGATLDPKQVTAALAALQMHLDAPTTAIVDLVQVIDAMAAIGGGAERPALTSHVLLYHADDELGADPTWAKAIVTALGTHGGPAEHELLRQIAADPRTKPNLTSWIRDSVGHDKE
jgi:PQQ-like domain